jgi:hypothetical protein
MSFTYHFDEAIEYPYVTALLPNHTTEIHNIETLSISQILSHPHTFEPHSISHDVSGYFVPSAQTEKLRTVTIPVLPPHPPTKSEETSEPTGSGLTPPPTPQKPTSARRSSSRSLSGLTRAQTLLVGAEAVHSLLPATLLSQVESLLEEGLMKQAIELAEQTKRKNTSGGIVQEDQVRQEVFRSVDLAHLWSLTSARGTTICLPATGDQVLGADIIRRSRRQFLPGRH